MSAPERLPEQSFLDHLEALRRVLLGWLLATAILYFPAYWATPHVIQWLVRRSCPPELGQLHFFAPMELFVVQLKFAFFLAFAAAVPWNLSLLWRFLLPALYRRERRVLRLFLLSSILLFAAGAAFALLVITPLLMRFSATFVSPEVQPLLGIASFLELSGLLALAFGAMFQLPVIVLALVHCGIIKLQLLSHSRPYVAVILLILAAILTPPDVVSQLLLFCPAYLLFEGALLIARRMRGKEKEEGEEKSF